MLEEPNKNEISTHRDITGTYIVIDLPQKMEKYAIKNIPKL